MQLQPPQLLKELLAGETSPCISIYMPTHRAKPPAAENPVRLSNLIRKAENELRAHYPDVEIAPLLEPVRRLQGDDAFWRNPADGLAIFASPDTFQVVKLQQPMPELVSVAETFHVKPLIRSYQFTGRYQVLCLTQRNVALYEGNREGLAQVPLRNVPRTLEEALGTELDQQQLTVSSYGGLEGAPMVHGQKSKKDEDDIDLERFFRAIDRAIWENHSRRAGLPLILCAVEHYHDRFRKVSHNPNLVDDGIALNPDSIRVERLSQEAWKIMEPVYRRQIDQLIDKFRLARSRQLGSEDLREIATAAAQSRIGMLLVDADSHIGGKIDDASGHLELKDINLPDVDDVIDDIAEKVMKAGGQVLVMPHEQMPTDTGVAAIYRF